MTNELEIIKNEVNPLVETAKNIIVKSKEQRIMATEFSKELDNKYTLLDEKFHFTDSKEKSYKAYKSACDVFNAFTEPFKTAKEILKITVKNYDRELAMEQQRMAAEAEAKRLEAERKEREKLEAQADKLIEKGKIEKAEEKLSQAENVSIAPQFVPTEKTRKLITKARVTNIMQLCKLIVDGVIPFSVIEVNAGALNSWAKTQDIATKYDGIQLYQDVIGRV